MFLYWFRASHRIPEYQKQNYEKRGKSDNCIVYLKLLSKGDGIKYGFTRRATKGTAFAFYNLSFFESPNVFLKCQTIP